MLLTCVGDVERGRAPSLLRLGGGFAARFQPLINKQIIIAFII
jgi:hypothetical protein